MTGVQTCALPIYSVTSSNMKPKLSFNHPCKELVWVAQLSHSTKQTANNNWFNYTTTNDAVTLPVTVDSSKKALGNSAITSKNPVSSAKLVLNGNDRFSQRNGSYFNLIQPFQHHENVPSNAGINVYSFALKPEDHQPSGTLNMSRIDTAVLNLTMDASVLNGQLFVYATNYNVLRILSGMGGLAYSN